MRQTLAFGTPNRTRNHNHNRSREAIPIPIPRGDVRASHHPRYDSTLRGNRLQGRDLSLAHAMIPLSLPDITGRPFNDGSLACSQDVKKASQSI